MADTDQQIEQARQAELGKLGSNGVARIDAVSRWLDAKGHGHLKPMLATAASVESFERLIRDGATPSSPKPAQQQASSDGKITDEQWSKMTAHEKFSYAREFQERERSIK